jgi:hypothetical protein
MIRRYYSGRRIRSLDRDIQWNIILDEDVFVELCEFLSANDKSE